MLYTTKVNGMDNLGTKHMELIIFLERFNGVLFFLYSLEDL